MIARVRSYLRRAREQGELRPLTDAQVDTILSEIEFMKLLEEKPLACRGCGKRAQVELTCPQAESGEVVDRIEYLCYEDLGTFLELFADPGVREWTVVRL